MIVILQPCLPKYRVRFYEELFELVDDLFLFCACEDYSGLKSVNLAHGGERVSECLKEKKIGPFVFQFNIFRSEIILSDTLVVTGNPRYLLNYFLLLIRKLLRKKTYWWGQGWSANTSLFSYVVRKILMCLFDGVVLYTEREANRMKNERVTPTRLTYLNNGLDISGCQFFVSPRVINEGSVTLVFIGRLTDKSKLGVVIEALKQVDLSLAVNLKIIGDGKLLREYENTFFPGAVSVEWLGAIYDEEVISSVMSEAHFFVYGGAVGLSLIHSMGYGVPSIVHRNALEHMPEIVAFEEGVTGFAFEKDDSQNLAQIISQASKFVSTDEYLEMRRYCREVVETRFTTEFMAKQMARFLRGEG